MTFALLSIYLMIFGTGVFFAYGSYLLFKELQQAPIADKSWVEDLEESSLQKNVFYRLALALARSLARLNVYWNLGNYEHVIDKNLDAAGRPWDLKASEFIGLKELCAIIFGLLAVWLWRVDPNLPAPLIVICLAMIGGFFVPNAILKKHTKDRQFYILRDLPFCCDLLSLSVDAGLDFAGAMDKVVLNGPPGPLLHELHIVVQETKIGKSRREALTDMMERVQLQEISSFVGSLVQAERMGIGFSSVLRIQSATVRRSRFERAEKKAQQMPVMILLPIIIINMVSIGIILVVPLLGIIKDFNS